MNDLDTITYAKNIFVEMSTQLVPPAILDRDICTSDEIILTSTSIENRILIIRGILKKTLTYQTFDKSSNIISNVVINEKEFTTSFPIEYDFNINNIFIDPCSKVISSIPSGIDYYHRAISKVAFNLTETSLVTFKIMKNCNDNSMLLSNNLCDDLNTIFAPRLCGISTKSFRIPLTGCLSNCTLDNLNIKRNIIASVNSVSAETLFINCCIVYYFFDNDDILIKCEKRKFSFIINSNTINAEDSYEVAGSDILTILKSKVVCQNRSNNCLDEDIVIKICARKNV